MTALLTTLLTDVMREVDERLARIAQAGTADVPQVFTRGRLPQARTVHLGHRDMPDVPRFGAGDYE